MKNKKRLAAWQLIVFSVLCLRHASAKSVAPQSLQVFACGNNKLALYWSKVKDARGYLISRRNVSRRENRFVRIAKLFPAADSFWAAR